MQENDLTSVVTQIELHDVYMIRITSALRIKNTSESDPRNYEVTNKAQNKFWGSIWIRTHDLRDTGAMLYQLNYEASPEAGQVQVLFIPGIWRKGCEVYTIKIIWENCG